jgi:hypothetical protein
MLINREPMCFERIDFVQGNQHRIPIRNIWVDGGICDNTSTIISFHSSHLGIGELLEDLAKDFVCIRKWIHCPKIRIEQTPIKRPWSNEGVRGIFQIGGPGRYRNNLVLLLPNSKPRIRKSAFSQYKNCPARLKWRCYFYCFLPFFTNLRHGSAMPSNQRSCRH